MCCGAALRTKSPLRVTSSRFRAENVDFERELLEILHSFDFKQRIMILSNTNLRNDTFFTPYFSAFPLQDLNKWRIPSSRQTLRSFQQFFVFSTDWRNFIEQKIELGELTIDWKFGLKLVINHLYSFNRNDSLKHSNPKK